MAATPKALRQLCVCQHHKFWGPRININRASKRCQVISTCQSSPFSSTTIIHQQQDSSKNSNRHLCQELKERSLIRVAGSDASLFLQGLITNDMECLHGDCELKAMYSHLLNVQGRVLYDLLLYNVSPSNDDNVFLVECDKEGVQDLLKILKRYKIRKKVDLSSVNDEYSTWAVFPQEFDPKLLPTGPTPCSAHLQEQYSAPPLQERVADIIVDTPDPRLRSFARRLILHRGLKGSDVIGNSQDCTDNDVYRRRRYQLGIAEGFADIPHASAIPLEYNLVFMNGVSFQKGCYIGQELTARTHHTGVIRKRIMPILLDSATHNAQPDDKVENSAGKNAGKFRNSCGQNALGLLRISDVLGQSLIVKNSEGQEIVRGTTEFPFWWPKESDEIVRQAHEQSQ